MSIVIINTLLNIGTLLLFYFIGSFILHFLKFQQSSTPVRQYFSILTGFIVSVAAWAVIMTSFKTSYLALLPFLIWGIVTRGKRLNNGPVTFRKEGLKKLILKISVFTFFTTLLLVTNYTDINQQDNSVPHFHNDYVFYANVAAHLNDTRVENYQLNSSSETINLYHYSEIWLTSLLNKISNEPYIKTFLFQTVPILFTLVWFGFFVIATTISKKSSEFTIFLLSTICFVVAPFALFVNPFSSILKGDVYDLIFTNYYKLSIIQLFIIGIFLTRKHLDYSIILLGLLGIIYPTTIPAIAATIIIILLYHYAKNRNSKIELVKLFFYWFSSTLLLLSILFLFSNENSTQATESIFEKYIVSIPDYLKTIVNIFGSTFLKITISCSPYIILAIILYKKIELSIKKVALSALLVFQVSGLLAWSLLLRMPDSVQLWFNVYLPVVSTCIFILLVLAFDDDRFWVKLFSISLIVLNFAIHFPERNKYHYASTEEKIIIQHIQSTPDPKFVFIRSANEFKSVFDKNVNFAIIANYISYFTKSYAPVCINTDQITAENSWEKEFIDKSPFAVFSASQHSRLSNAQLKYIAMHQVKFLISSENVSIPPYIDRITDTTINDHHNKIKVLILKNNYSAK
ncbi:MAG: hypothetical protein KA450_04190 [Bacteroidia bacterium]|nr:hypothetical protein [Bacteroidia bacterium]